MGRAKGRVAIVGVWREVEYRGKGGWVSWGLGERRGRFASVQSARGCSLGESADERSMSCRRICQHCISGGVEMRLGPEVYCIVFELSSRLEICDPAGLNGSPRRKASQRKRKLEQSSIARMAGSSLIILERVRSSLRWGDVCL